MPALYLIIYNGRLSLRFYRICETVCAVIADVVLDGYLIYVIDMPLSD